MNGGAWNAGATMAEEKLPALLTAEGAELTDPEQVERALAALWKPPPAFGPRDATQQATRVCAANLVAVAGQQDWTRLGHVLGELSPDYPTRTIVWLVPDTARTRRARHRSVRGWVFALCHLPQPSRPQVCSEQIVLRGSAGRGRDMVRTLLPLLESDVPTMTWWRLPAGSLASWYAALCGLSDRLVIDAGLTGVTQVRQAARCAVREIGWYRTAGWREWIAELFDTAADEPFPEIEQVHIRLGGEAAETRVDALWIAAFLAGQLGWRPVRREDGVFVLGSRRRTIPVRLDVDTQGPPGIETVAILAGPRRYEITRAGCGRCAYRITYQTDRLCRPARCVEPPGLDAADALVAAFTGRPTDPAFDRAAPIAAWMAAEWMRGDGP